MNITDSKEYLDSVKIGRLLADRGYHVKCGGYRGLMEAVSKGVRENDNGTVTGYTCREFNSVVGNEYLTDTIVCNDLPERLREMITGSDVFVFQKGGIGTFSELFLLLDITRKKKERPRIILVGEFWLPIMEVIKGISSEKDLRHVEIVGDYEEFESKF